MTDLRLRASDFAARYCRWDAINEVTDVLTALLQAVDAEATERLAFERKEAATAIDAALGALEQEAGYWGDPYVIGKGATRNCKFCHGRASDFEWEVQIVLARLAQLVYKGNHRHTPRETTRTPIQHTPACPITLLKGERE